MELFQVVDKFFFVSFFQNHISDCRDEFGSFRLHRSVCHYCYFPSVPIPAEGPPCDRRDGLPGDPPPAYGPRRYRPQLRRARAPSVPRDRRPAPRDGAGVAVAIVSSDPLRSPHFVASPIPLSARPGGRGGLFYRWRNDAYCLKAQKLNENCHEPETNPNHQRLCHRE